MSLLPPIGMPKPNYFLRGSATVSSRLSTQSASGGWAESDFTTYTVRCSLQPATSADAIAYASERPRTLYTLFLDTVTTSGVSVSSFISNISKVTIAGIVYQVDGRPLDLCDANVVYMLTVYKED